MAVSELTNIREVTDVLVLSVYKKRDIPAQIGPDREVDRDTRQSVNDRAHISEITDVLVLSV